MGMLRAMLASTGSTDRRRRGDRCPGSLRLHEAADGHLARVRLPGGRLRPHQVEVLARAATDLGDGDLHATSRANLQLRGLAGGCGPELADRLYAAGLLPSPAHDRVRNIVASPLAGFDDGGLVDIEPVLADLDARVCSAPDLTELSGRFLLAVDDGRRDTLGLDPDLAVVAEPGGRLRLWVAGRPTGHATPAEGAAALLVAAARSFLRVRADVEPGAWRVADLGAAAGGVAAVQWEVTAPSTGTGIPATDLGLVGPHRGTWAVVAGLPLGRASAGTWRAVGGVASASALGPSTAPIRVTPWRGVVVGGLTRPTAQKALALLAGGGLITDPTCALAGVSACAGRPGCASALSDVRADALALAARHPVRPLHVSGCGRRCGRAGGDGLDAVATSEGRYLVATPAGAAPAGADVEVL